MLKGKLTITLKSDLCAGTGESLAGIVDIETAVESCGLPLLPAKRIKGILRELASELRYSEGEINALFGQPGSENGGALLLENGAVQDAQRIRDAAVTSGIAPAELSACYTSLRTRTAIGADGRAQEGSLRTMRVIDKGTVFICPITLTDDALQPMLTDCTMALRAIGLNRMRGFGEVAASLTLASVAAAIPATVTHNEQVERSYTLTLRSPISLKGRDGADIAKGCLYGTSLLGAFAGLYLRTHKPCMPAHEDPVFQRIFLDGGVIFEDALLLKDGNISIPAPGYLMREKNADVYHDVAQEFPENTQVKRLNGNVIIQNEWLAQVDTPIDIYYRHFRPVDKGLGHAQGEGDGDLFVQQAIQAGISYQGRLIGDKADVDMLFALAKEYGLRIGQSRSTEYGGVDFSPVLHSNEWFVSSGKETAFTVALLSPAILVNDIGTNVCTGQALFTALGLDEMGASIKGCFLRLVTISGYNARWQLPRTQVQALDAGTALVIVCDKPVDLYTLSQKRVGMRTNEGFGRLYVQKLQDKNTIYSKMPENNALGREVTQVPEIIKDKRNKEYARIQAIECARDNANGLNNSMLSRLMGLLESYPERERFMESLKQIKQKDRLAKCTNLIKAADCGFEKCKLNESQYWLPYMQSFLNQCKLEGRKTYAK